MSFEDQIQLHPSGEVFRDHLMTQVKAENKVSIFLCCILCSSILTHKKLTPTPLHPLKDASFVQQAN